MLNLEARGKTPLGHLNGGSRSKVPPPVAILSPTQQLERWMDRGRSEVFTVTTTLTPDMAQMLLDRNPENRNVTVGKAGRQRSVTAYADMMARGEWRLNGETIIVSRDGLLNDGQHRCTACVASGAAIPVTLVFGVERETRHTVDQGKGRTLSDVFTIDGEVNTKNLATAIQFVWAYEGDRDFSQYPSIDQARDTLTDNPELRQAITDAIVFCREFRLSKGYVAGALHVCRQFSPTAAEAFFDKLKTGLNLTNKKDPILLLRQRYAEQARDLKSARMSSDEQAALFIKAFNLWQRGRLVGQNLRWRSHGQGAERFPRVGM